MEYLPPLLGIRTENTVEFPIKISHLTSIVHRLLSDHLVCWKEPILASYSFLGLLKKGLSYVVNLEMENSPKFLT